MSSSAFGVTGVGEGVGEGDFMTTSVKEQRTAIRRSPSFLYQNTRTWFGLVEDV